MALGCEGRVPRAEIARELAALDRPNLVLCVVDTLRADWTTPYGFEHDTTPELARWASRGVLFERVRAQSSWTKISMASLMTSLWPRTLGITQADDGLSDEAVLFAEVLRDAGYATYAVQTNGWLHQSFGFHQGFDRYIFPRGGAGAPLARPSIWPHADNVYREAVRLLEAQEPGQPFFVYLHFMDVHEYAAPPDFRSFGTDSKGAYLGAIRWVDHVIGRVRKKLAAEGLLDRTLLVLAADHGETFGEHGIHGHARNVLTPVVWVPLVLRFPFPTEAVRVATQIRNVDLAPTLLDLLGLEIPPGFEGRTVAPWIAESEEGEDRSSYAGLGIPLFPDASVQTALHEGAWTYARNAPAEGEDSKSLRFAPVAPGAEFLFDRSIDPSENVNLVELEPEEAARMRARLDRHLEAGPLGVKATGVRIDPEIADRLRAMGYLR